MIHSVRFALATVLVSSVSVESAGDELVDLRQEPLATLVRDLGSEKPDVRQSAARALYEPVGMLPIDQWSGWEPKRDRAYRKQALPLLGDLIGLLAHRDPLVVETAMMLITRLEADGAAAVPVLAELANDERRAPSMRWQAAQTIFFVTPETMPVTPLLMPLPDSSNSVFGLYHPVDRHPENDAATATSIQMCALVVAQLLHTSGHTKCEVPHLIKATAKEYSTEVRATVVTILGELGSESQAGVSALRSLLLDDEPLVRRLAASAVARIELTPHIKLDDFEAGRLGSDEQTQIQQIAAHSVRHKQREYRQLVAAVSDDLDFGLAFLIHDVRRGPGSVRRHAIRILGDVGASAMPAVPPLIKALIDDDAETRRLAADSLFKIGAHWHKLCRMRAQR